MKQNVYQPLPVENQIVLLRMNDMGLLDELAVDLYSISKLNFWML
jgi:hypothetical protein